VRSLLADLVERGLAVGDGLLVVLDDAKALSAAVREVFGDKALIQRCTLHERRNLSDHLPDKEQVWVDAKLVKAFAHPDLDAGLRNAKSLAAQLDKNYRSAAASLREVLDEMFTVARPRHRRPAHHVQPGRVDDLHRPDHQPKRHPVARRPNGAALDRGPACSTPNDPSAASRATNKCPSSSPPSTDTPTPKPSPTPKLVSPKRWTRLTCFRGGVPS